MQQEVHWELNQHAANGTIALIATMGTLSAADIVKAWGVIFPVVKASLLSEKE